MLAAIGALQQKGGIVNRQRNRFSDGAGLQGPWEILAHYIVLLWPYEYHISGMFSVMVVLLF